LNNASSDGGSRRAAGNTGQKWRHDI
jgi:hypothetical protein